MFITDDEAPSDASYRPTPAVDADNDNVSVTISEDLPELADIVAGPRKAGLLARERLSATTYLPDSIQLTDIALDNITQLKTTIAIKPPAKSCIQSGLPTPPDSDLKRKRPFSLTPPQGDTFNHVPDPRTTPGKRARFDEPLITGDAPRVSPDDRVFDEPSFDVPEMSGALLFDHEIAPAIIPQTPRQGKASLEYDDEERTVSDANDMTMDRIHVPWSVKGGDEPMLMSTEALRMLPAIILDYVRNCSNIHQTKADQKDVSKTEREKFLMRHKLLYEVQIDLKSRILHAAIKAPNSHGTNSVMLPSAITKYAQLY